MALCLSFLICKMGVMVIYLPLRVIVRAEWLTRHTVLRAVPGIYAAAAKLLQSCLTLCNPIDGSPTGCPIPGILQARTLEWEERDKKCLTLAAFFLCLETPGIPACYPLSWKKIYDQLGQHIKKQRHYFTDKGPSNKNPSFSSSHVWM